MIVMILYNKQEHADIHSTRLLNKFAVFLLVTNKKKGKSKQRLSDTNMKKINAQTMLLHHNRARKCYVVHRRKAFAHD